MPSPLTRLAAFVLTASLLVPTLHAQVPTVSTPPAATPPATQPAAKPTPYRFIIISLDGMRPDLLLRAETPNLKKFLDQSTYTMWAKTTAVSVTLPSHTSMLTGVQPQIHEIVWNGDLPFSEGVYPKVPTLFEVAKKAGYSTALVAGKDKFIHLNKPGTIDHVWITEKSTTSDDEVASNADRILRSYQPDVMFIHYPATDNVGHAKGWSSAEQMKAIAHVDQLFGQLLATVDAIGATDKTYILVSADHGGSGKTHGPDDVRARMIPWILHGPNVRQNYDLTIIKQLEVKTEDTFATACYLLKLPLPPKTEGTPVLPVLQDLDLMK